MKGEGVEGGEGVRGAVLIYFSMSEHSKELIELHLCKLSPSLSLSNRQLIRVKEYLKSFSISLTNLREKRENEVNVITL